MPTALPKPQVPWSRSGGSSTHTMTKKTITTKNVWQHHHREVPQYRKERKPSHARRSVLWVLIIVVAGVMLWIQKDLILAKLQERWLRGDTIENTDMSQTLFVGQDVTLSGSITAHSDRFSYTHKLTTADHGIVGLKSSTIPLQQYSDDIQIVWKVSDYEDGLYIIDVTSISLLSLSTNTWTVLSGKYYIASAGIIISDLASDNLTRDQSDTAASISQWLFSISDSTTNNKVMVRYIRCDTSNPARDCAWFVKSFDTAQRADFVDSYGNTFYKLADAKTWFASIDNTIGIYLESDDMTIIPRVIRHLQFVNNVRAKKTFLTTAKEICISPDIAINMPTSFTVVPYEDGFAVNVEWTAINGWSLTCMIAIDPSNSLGGTLIGLNTEGNTISGSVIASDDNNDDSSEDTNTPTNPTIINNNGWGMTPPSATVKQFPLRPGKELTFNSRGKKIIFPSSNISFSSFNTSEKIAWLSCSMGTKVIIYADKANLESDPSIILYNCKTGTPSLSDTMVSFDAAGMTYIVDVKDPSWYEFATHIVIEATTSN